MAMEGIVPGKRPSKWVTGWSRLVLAFVLLFTVVGGAAIPAVHTAYAQDASQKDDLPTDANSSDFKRADGRGVGAGVQEGKGVLDNAKGDIANAAASAGNSVLNAVIVLIGSILRIVAQALIWVLTRLIDILVGVVQYNNFTSATAVVKGWVVVRDLTNMGFVLVLLVYAFGHIFGHAKYRVTTDRVKDLFFYAIVINFSRTIAAVMIDFSQVVMLTFVAGFRELAVGNLLNALQMDKMLDSGSWKSPATDDIDGTASFGIQLVASLGLAIFVLAVSLSTIGWLAFMFIGRIVTLWLLIVVSPGAFFLRLVPGFEKYLDKWFAALRGQLIFGPLAAFFLWLSFTVMQSQTAGSGFVLSSTDSIGSAGTSLWKTDVLLSYAVGLMLLIKGIQMAKSQADTGLNPVGEFLDKSLRQPITNKVREYSKGALDKARSGAKTAGALTGGLLLAGAERTASGVGAALAWAPGTKQLVNLGKAGKDKLAVRKMLKEQRAADADAEHEFEASFEGDAATLAQIQRLRNDGNASTAAERFKLASDMEKKLVVAGADAYVKRKTKAEALRGTMNDSDASAVDRQRAMLALAKIGDDTLKGKAMDLKKMVTAVGGGDDLEKQLREALKEKGDKDADIKKPEDAKRLVEDLQTARQKAEFFNRIDESMDPDASGMPKRSAAKDYLLALDAESFNEKDNKGKYVFNNNQRNSVRKALLKAEALSSSQDQKDAIAKKYEELLGTAIAADADRSAVTDAVVAKRAEARTKATKEGWYKGEAVDQKAKELFGESDEAKEIFSDLKNLETKVKSKEYTPEVGAVEAQKIAERMERAAQSLPAKRQGTPLVGASGKEMSAADVMQQSRVVSDLKELGNVDPKDAAKRVEAVVGQAITSLEGAVPEEKPGIATRAKQVVTGKPEDPKTLVARHKSGLTTAANGLGTASETATEEVKLAALKKAAQQGSAAGSTLIKKAESAMSKDVVNKLTSIVNDLEKLKDAKTYDASVDAQVKDIKKRIDDTTKLIS